MSWVLTWFGHDLQDLPSVSRLYDVLLGAHPTLILYICAAVSFALANFELSTHMLRLRLRRYYPGRLPSFCILRASVSIFTGCSWWESGGSVRRPIGLGASVALCNQRSFRAFPNVWLLRTSHACNLFYLCATSARRLRYAGFCSIADVG